MSNDSLFNSPNAVSDVAVIGAGIIGVACALRLARQGRRVVVIDQQEPGRGASFGNAGHLATEQVFPIADLSILKRLPAMLLDPMGPLRLDWKYMPRALPWFMRLLLNLRPAPFQRTVAGIRALNESSLGAWNRLLEAIERPRLLKEDGSLLVFERADSQQAIEALQARMRQQQVPVDFWQAGAVRDAAPQLSEQIRGGLFFPRTGHFLDPFRVVGELVHAAKSSGVQFLQQRVEDGQLNEHGVSLITDQGRVSSRQVLIACGAHSAKLTAALTGKKVPLDTERGYHLMLPHEHQRLPFAVTSLRIVSLGFVFYGCGMTLTQSVNGAGDTWTPTFINVFIFWIFEIPLAWMLAYGTRLGASGVPAALAIAYSMLAVISAIVFRRGGWKRMTV